MILKDFQKQFYFQFKVLNQANINLIATTEVVRRTDNKVLDGVKATIDIQDTNDWIVNSQTAISLTPWDWNKLLEQTKRYQLDYFALRVPIDNFFPLNQETEIESLYK